MKENIDTKSGTAAGMAENFKKATTEMLVLFLLAKQPMYVYQMIQNLDHLSESVFKVATLYPAIYRLQNNLYIEEFEKRISDDNRLRKYYAITESGREYLQELQQEYLKLTDAVSLIFRTDMVGEFREEEAAEQPSQEVYSKSQKAAELFC